MLNPNAATFNPQTPIAAEPQPDTFESQPILYKYYKSLTPSQITKLDAIFRKTVELISTDPKDPPIRFKVGNFVKHVIFNGYIPNLIGGASQSLFVEKDFLDVDIAVFFPEQPDPEYFTQLCLTYFQSLRPSFTEGDLKSKKYVRWNAAHQSMETKEFDFKFVSFLDKRTHLFHHDALCTELSLNAKSQILGRATLVPYAKFGEEKGCFKEALDCLLSKKLKLSDPCSVIKPLFRVCGHFTKGFTSAFNHREVIRLHLDGFDYQEGQFLRELDYYLEGHVSKETIDFFIANLMTLLDEQSPHPRANIFLELLKGRYGKHFQAKVFLDNFLSVDDKRSFLKKESLITPSKTLLRGENESHLIRQMQSDPQEGEGVLPKLRPNPFEKGESSKLAQAICCQILRLYNTDELCLEQRVALLESKNRSSRLDLDAILQALTDPVLNERGRALFHKLSHEGKILILDALTGHPKCREQVLQSIFDRSLSMRPEDREKHLNQFDPSLRVELLLLKNNFTKCSLNYLVKSVQEIGITHFSTQNLIEIFHHLSLDRKVKLGRFEEEILECLVDRKEDQREFPLLFELLGRDLITLKILPEQTCLKLLREYPSCLGADYPDWIKALLLKFYAVKSGASTPLDEFASIVTSSKVSSCPTPFMEMVSQHNKDFFTQGLGSLIDRHPCKLTAAHLYRFSPVKSDEAANSFKDILQSTATYENIKGKLFDFLSFVEQLAQEDPLAALKAYNHMANFLHEGFREGVAYSFEETFELFGKSLLKILPLSTGVESLGQRIQGTMTKLVIACFDPKDDRLIRFLEKNRILLGLEPGGGQYPHILDAAMVSIERSAEIVELTKQIDSNCRKETSGNQLAHISLALMIQKAFLDIEKKPDPQSFNRESIKSLGFLFMGYLHHGALEGQKCPFYNERMISSSKNIMKFVHRYRKEIDAIYPTLALMDGEKDLFAFTILNNFCECVEICKQDFDMNEWRLFFDGFGSAVRFAIEKTNDRVVDPVYAAYRYGADLVDLALKDEQEANLREFIPCIVEKIELFKEKRFSLRPLHDMHKACATKFAEECYKKISAKTAQMANGELKEWLKGESSKILQVVAELKK